MENRMELKEGEQPDGETPAPLGPGDEQWEAELERAIGDIRAIANDRASWMSN
jgi:hypothetical protein